MKNNRSKFIEEKDFELYADVANLITEARLYKGWTQAKLAEMVGTQQPSIARVENGSSLPSLSFLLQIAHAIGTYMIAPKFGFMVEVKEGLNTKSKIEETETPTTEPNVLMMVHSYGYPSIPSRISVDLKSLQVTN